MALPAHAPDGQPRTRPPPRPRGPRPPPLSAVPSVQTDIPADPQKPTVGIHAGAVKIAVAAAFWFVAATAVLFASGDAFVDYPLAIVFGFAVVFFGLTLGLARWAANDERWSPRRPQPFARFVEDNVAIETGTIAAREALIQIVALPITLAAGITAIGIVFVMSG